MGSTFHPAQRERMRWGWSRKISSRVHGDEMFCCGIQVELRLQIVKTHFWWGRGATSGRQKWVDGKKPFGTGRCHLRMNWTVVINLNLKGVKCNKRIYHLHFIYMGIRLKSSTFYAESSSS